MSHARGGTGAFWDWLIRRGCGDDVALDGAQEPLLAAPPDNSDSSNVKVSVADEEGLRRCISKNDVHEHLAIETPQLDASAQATAHEMIELLIPNHQHVSTSPPHNNSQYMSKKATLSVATTPSSWSANLLFLIGSSLYVWLAVWDMRLLQKETGTESIDDDDNSKSSTSTSSSPGFWSLYMAVSAAAASCYVIVAILQVVPTSENRERTSSGSNRGECAGAAIACTAAADSASGTYLWSSGLTFGCGAILDLVSAVSGTMRDQHCTKLSAWAASHLYLVNAVLLVLYSNKSDDKNGATTLELGDGTTTVPTSQSSVASNVPTTSGHEAAATRMRLAEQTERLGDYLFLVGSLVDVSLCYLYFGDNKSDVMWEYIYRGNFVTSLLWWVDSGLYIAADVLAAHCAKSMRNDRNTTSLDSSQRSAELADAEAVTWQNVEDDSVVPLLIQATS